MNILITGGTGFVGDELRTLLLRKGHNLVIVTRSPQKYEDENAKNQRFIAWDDDLVAAVNQVEAVINLAGENIFAWRWTPEKKERILNSRVQGTTKLVEAMRDAENKPAVFISASGGSIYGDRGDEILNESEPSSEDFLAKVCDEWEAAAQKASEFGVRVVTPRIGVVLEEGGGALEKMIPPFQFFVGGPIGSGNQYMSWIHRADLCRSFIHALENEQLKGPYNACSPNPLTMDEFSKTLGVVMNRPSIFRVPEFAINMAMGEVAKTVTDSIRMQPQKLQATGFDFRFEELEEALADIL